MPLFSLHSSFHLVHVAHLILKIFNPLLSFNFLWKFLIRVSAYSSHCRNEIPQKTFTNSFFMKCFNLSFLSHKFIYFYFHFVYFIVVKYLSKYVILSTFSLMMEFFHFLSNKCCEGYLKIYMPGDFHY